MRPRLLNGWTTCSSRGQGVVTLVAGAALPHPTPSLMNEMGVAAPVAKPIQEKGGALR